jgi:hypothetical protein
VGALVSVFPDQAEALFGPMGYTNPAFIFIVYTPGIVALVLVARHFGIRGLGRFFRRLTLWRCRDLVAAPAGRHARGVLRRRSRQWHNWRPVPVHPLVLRPSGADPGSRHC